MRGGGCGIASGMVRMMRCFSLGESALALRDL